MSQKHPKQKIIWVHLQKDHSFLRRDEIACGRLTQRAIASLQSKIHDAIVAETKDLTRAQVSFKVLQLPNSKSYFLRKEQQRQYEAPKKQMTLLDL